MGSWNGCIKPVCRPDSRLAFVVLGFAAKVLTVEKNSEEFIYYVYIYIYMHIQT